jgi:hypothetical protein
VASLYTYRFIIKQYKIPIILKYQNTITVHKSENVNINLYDNMSMSDCLD